MSQVSHIASNSGSGSGSSATPSWGNGAGGGGGDTLAGGTGVVILTFGDNSRVINQQLDNPPAGWRLAFVGENGNGAPGHTVYVYVKPNLIAEEPDPVFTRGGVSDQFVWWIGEYDNGDIGTVIRAFATRDSAANPHTSHEIDTEVDESLVVCAWTVGDENASGAISDGTFTERADLNATNLSLYVYDKEFGTAGLTGSPTLNDSGADSAVCMMFSLQPTRGPNVADVQTFTHEISAPTTAQLVNYTQPGFDAKSIDIQTLRVDDENLTEDSEYSRGVGADDGDTAKAQAVVGFWHDDGVASERDWWDDTQVVKHFNRGNTSPDWEASYSKIADGYSLDWTDVGGTAHKWLVTVRGGADYRAAVGIGDLGGTTVTSLSWRPNFVHTISACVAGLDTPGTRTTGMLSFGMFDDQGGQACFCHDYDADENFVVRNLSFMAQVNNNLLSYEAEYQRMLSNGFEWVIDDSTTDEFYFLAHNFNAGNAGNDKEYRYQIDRFYGDDSGTNDTDQTLPHFDDGGEKRAAEIFSSGEPGTQANFGNASYCDGRALFDEDDAVEFQTVYAYATFARTTSERQRLASSFVLSTNNGLLGTATERRGALTDHETINWNPNTTTGAIHALATFGPAGGDLPFDGEGDTKFDGSAEMHLALDGEGDTLFDGEADLSEDYVGEGTTLFDGDADLQNVVSGEGDTLFDGDAGRDPEYDGDGQTLFDGSGEIQSVVGGDGQTLFNGDAHLCFVRFFDGQGDVGFDGSAELHFLQDGQGDTLFDGDGEVGQALDGAGETSFDGDATPQIVFDGQGDTSFEGEADLEENALGTGDTGFDGSATLHFDLVGAGETTFNGEADLAEDGVGVGTTEFDGGGSVGFRLEGDGDAGFGGGAEMVFNVDGQGETLFEGEADPAEDYDGAGATQFDGSAEMHLAFDGAGDTGFDGDADRDFAGDGQATTSFGGDATLHFDLDGEGETTFDGDAPFEPGLLPNTGADCFDMKRHDGAFDMKRHDDPFDMERN